MISRTPAKYMNVRRLIVKDQIHFKKLDTMQDDLSAIQTDLSSYVNDLKTDTVSLSNRIRDINEDDFSNIYDGSSIYLENDLFPSFLVTKESTGVDVINVTSSIANMNILDDSISFAVYFDMSIYVVQKSNSLFITRLSLNMGGEGFEADYVSDSFTFGGDLFSGTLHDDNIFFLGSSPTFSFYSIFEDKFTSSSTTPLVGANPVLVSSNDHLFLHDASKHIYNVSSPTSNPLLNDLVELPYHFHNMVFHHFSLYFFGSQQTNNLYSYHIRTGAKREISSLGHLGYFTDFLSLMSFNSQLVLFGMEPEPYTFFALDVITYRFVKKLNYIDGFSTYPTQPAKPAFFVMAQNDGYLMYQNGSFRQFVKLKNIGYRKLNTI